MGRWFPNIRKGTREQVREHDTARRALQENAEYEKKHGIQHETRTYLDLNDRVAATEKPLSGWQRWTSNGRLIREDNQERRTERRERRFTRRETRGTKRLERMERHSDGQSARLAERGERRDDRREYRSQKRESQPSAPKRSPRTRARRRR